MKNIDFKELATLSPFEIKNVLIEAAGQSHQAMLNAGRGNPNFLATVPREGFFQFGLFAMAESERSFSFMPEGVGGFPHLDGIEARFEAFTRENAGKPGVQFIRAAVSFVRDQLGLPADQFIYEMCEAILGCNYPVPDRMLKLTEKIVNHYIRKEMIGNNPYDGEFDMYAVEGGTAAMTYLFNSMRENHLLSPGDSIALGMPIFTPYIEIPKLNDYKLNIVPIEARPENGWQFTAEELEKLLDPKIKAFFLVNPSNPPSVKMSDENLCKLAEIVEKRPDLIILTDDVYGTFADDFTSLFAICPKNTILVYSYSKYFGATGWRLGVVALHQDNILDRKIAALPEKTRTELCERYESISTDPDKIKFIDRLVADSRTVALNHTAGLATPVQAMMAFFSLFALMDVTDSYKNAMKRLIRRRKDMLFRESKTKPPHDPNSVDYYQLVDVSSIILAQYGKEFMEWLLKRLQPNEALFRLAEETGVVLLPSKGFGTSIPSFRVSLANLTEVEYMNIGRAIKKIGRGYYEEYRKGKGKKKS